MSPITNTTTPRNPFVFLVGCPRSGTTLLQRMVNAHPQLAVANDTHFIPRALKKINTKAHQGDWVTLPLTEDLVSSVRHYRRFPRLGVAEEAVNQAANRAQTYSDFVSELYLEFAGMHGKALGGEKTPDYVKCLPLLHGLFPWVKTAHIIRDGRDVALSTLQWANPEKGPGKFELWKTEPVAVCALWWRQQVGLGRRDAALLKPDRYHELRYEDLVSDPATVLRSVTDFLGLDFASEMLSFNEGKVRSDSGLSAKKAWLGPTPGLRDWRVQMDNRSVELFEALAGDLLLELGYERIFTEISPSITAVAQRCRDWWAQAVKDDVKIVNAAKPINAALIGGR